jgi:hypothetical protein
VLDLTVPFAEAMGALTALCDAIVAEYPRDPETGRMLDRTLGADGAVTWGALPTAALPQVTAALDVFLASLA